MLPQTCHGFRDGGVRCCDFLTELIGRAFWAAVVVSQRIEYIEGIFWLLSPCKRSQLQCEKRAHFTHTQSQSLKGSMEINSLDFDQSRNSQGAIHAR